MGMQTMHPRYEPTHLLGIWCCHGLLVTAAKSANTDTQIHSFTQTSTLEPGWGWAGQHTATTTAQCMAAQVAAPPHARVMH